MITNSSTNQEVAASIGQRIKDARIAQGLTQAQLAAHAGVSARTLTNLECGHDVTCSVLFSVLAALGLLANLDALVPEQGPRPSDIAKLGKKRQRYRASKTPGNTNGWVWGEDA